jgi:hypothetical protein
VQQISITLPVTSVVSHERDRCSIFSSLRSKLLGGTHALPASALGRAAQYTLALWLKLMRFLDHPELELSNNLAENSMRPLVVGRKNWIHLGSQHAGPKVAAILSIVETCRRLKIPVRDYLAAVLPGLADRPMQYIKQLTPAAWAVAIGSNPMR